MHIRDYEQPDGWLQGHPEVLVTRKVVKELGNPVVDYDSLHQFLTDDIGIPYDTKTSIRLYGRFDKSPIGGYHVPYTSTVHVNALMAEDLYSVSGGTMRVLAHELRHRADSTNRRIATAFDIAARWASYKVGLEAAELVPYLAAVPVMGAIATRHAWYVFEPSERRARAEEQKPAVIEHQDDIFFPKSMRALFLNWERTEVAITRSKRGN